MVQHFSSCEFEKRDEEAETLLWMVWGIIGILLMGAAVLFCCALGLFRFAAVRHAPRHWEN
ncbi:MAG: hypothetical protein RRZ93_01360, partial [Ruthenibacterium sp.]